MRSTGEFGRDIDMAKNTCRAVTCLIFVDDPVSTEDAEVVSGVLQYWRLPPEAIRSVVSSVAPVGSVACNLGTRARSQRTRVPVAQDTCQLLWVSIEFVTKKSEQNDTSSFIRTLLGDLSDR